MSREQSIASVFETSYDREIELNLEPWSSQEAIQQSMLYTTYKPQVNLLLLVLLSLLFKIYMHKIKR